MTQAAAPTTLAVTVKFPLSKEKHYRADLPRTARVGDVRTAAMGHYGVADDSSYRYYLTHQRETQPEERTLDQVAGPAHAVEFRLVKELVQG